LGDEDVLVVDCRDEQEWIHYQFHIPGALRMSYEELVQDARILPDDELIVLCGCAEGAEDMYRAYHWLRRRGLAVVCLEGGLQAWLSKGLPTESHMVTMHAPAMS
jgi:rhodanese-related sulfurtransferase